VLIRGRYNSVVFQTIATNDIDFLFITGDFLTTRGGWRKDHALQNLTADDPDHDYYQAIQDTLLDEQYLDASRFENISATECFSRYTSLFIRAGNGFAVVPIASSNGYDNSSLVDVVGGTGQLEFGNDFITDISCKFTPIRGCVPPFSSHLHFADCLSEISPERCQVQLNQNIMYIVIACNVLKAALMFMVLEWMNYETIVTIGDAIETFIRKPDVTTKDCCLTASRTVKQLWKTSEARQSQRYQLGSKDRWYSVISGKRWLFSLVS
jgi:hypothetical protein